MVVNILLKAMESRNDATSLYIGGFGIAFIGIGYIGLNTSYNFEWVINIKKSY
jgi:hypothetical protein